MKILGLEFSSPQRSAAVVRPSGKLGQWIESEAVETGVRTGRPFELIEEALRQAGLEREQLDLLAIGLGPGSYSGIRAAIALAQGWQLGRGIPLQGLSSVHCVAAEARAQGVEGRVAVVVDAQRGEFYLANFDLFPNGCQEVQPLRIVSRSAVAEIEHAGELVIGPEVDRWFPRGRVIFPRAATLAKLASQHVNPQPGEKLEPIYLRATTFVKAPPPRVLPE